MTQRLKQYVVDAFTDHVFSGNPAAICITDEWLQEKTMMDITRENNLSETAFAVKEGAAYRLRWFTPGGEIDLCGHATLACAYVIMNFIEKAACETVFETLSGRLTVTKRGELYEMDFPAYNLRQIPVTGEIVEALGASPREAYMGRDMLCVFDEDETVRSLSPDQERLSKLDGLLMQVTARGREADCVSRSFAPKCGVAEDPVCGSGHCHIVPYWAQKLGKNEITAYQASARGGTLYCRMDGERVKLAGKAALYAESTIYLPEMRRA